MIRLFFVMTVVLIAQVASASSLVFRGTYADPETLVETRATMTVSNAGGGDAGVFIDVPGSLCVISMAPAPIRNGVLRGLTTVRVAAAQFPVLNRCGLNENIRSVQLVLRYDSQGNVIDATLRTPWNHRARWTFFYGKAAVL